MKTATKKIESNSIKQEKSKFASAWENSDVKPLIYKINDMRAVLR